ncbi:MAG: succinate--CoA ligase subunit alpha [candidate division WOR-3 bacterium]
MSIFARPDSRVVVQGITGRDGAFHAKAMLDYGTKIQAGVTPGKGGQSVFGIPVFNTVAQAKSYTGVDTSVIFVPAAFATDAIFEAIDAEMELVVCVSEGVPVHDMIRIMAYLESVNRQEARRPTRLLGPNCPGLIVPGMTKLGIMPNGPFRPGGIGIVSRSGTLTYELAWQVSRAGLGQSTVVGVGGDPIKGTGFIETLAAFAADPQTEAIILVGEIGGSEEEEAAEYIRKYVRKPVLGFIAGLTAPPDKRMGHAGAIVTGRTGLAADKIKALESAGITVGREPEDLVQKLRMQLMVRSADA